LVECHKQGDSESKKKTRIKKIEDQNPKGLLKFRKV